MGSGGSVDYPPVSRDEIDGVPVIWAELPGGFQAALMFRVGRADETLATSGITHLVEHLALPGIPHDDYDHNGMVEQARTVFYARGEPDEVAGFLADLCRRLGDLPVDRIDREAGILLTEEASAPPNPVSDLERIRFGAAGYGLVGHDQVGLNRLSAAEVEAWSSRFFTRGNCVLILSGPPPRGIQLPLPAGVRMPPPAPAPLPYPGPIWFNSLPGMVAMGVVGSRRDGLGLSLRCVAQRLHRLLRQERGLIYSAGVVDDALGATLVHRVLLADCMEENAAAVMDGMLEAVNEVASSGPTEAELRTERSGFLREVREPEAMLGWLDYLAADELNGLPVSTLEEYLEEVLTVSAERTRAALEAVLPEAILLLPDGLEGPDAPWHRLPEPDDEPIRGRQFRRSGLARLISDERCIVGEDGISMYGGGTWMTIPWERVALLMLLPSSVLSIVDRTGGGIQLDLAAWGSPRDLERAVRERIPGHLVVDLAAR